MSLVDRLTSSAHRDKPLLFVGGDGLYLFNLFGLPFFKLIYQILLFISLGSILVSTLFDFNQNNKNKIHDVKKLNFKIKKNNEIVNCLVSLVASCHCQSSFLQVGQLKGHYAVDKYSALLLTQSLRVALACGVLSCFNC